MNAIKMVVTDMDGTLLNSNHEVSSRFYNAFHQLKQKGIQFVVATGRPYYSTIKKLDSIKNEIIIVAENGGLVSDNKTLIHSNNIDSTTLLELYNLVTKIEDTYPIFCTKNRAYIIRTSTELIAVFSEYYSEYTLIDKFEEINDDVIKIALYHTHDSEKHIYPFVKHLNKQLNVVISGNNWVDISNTNSNKGNAIKLLQKRLNIKQSETMAFGDYNNDLELLKYAKYSYAMANAHPKVKAVANYDTASNDEFGVEIILEALIKNLNNE
jgi:Cof subfamily protein (haloacid dehalogenase superfamily)